MVVVPRAPRSSLARHPWAAFFLVALSAEALMACGPGRGATSAPAPAPAPVQTGPRGSDVYFRSCARCHGDAQEGKNDSPALDSVRLTSLGDQRLRLTITTGKGRMPGFGGLTPTQVDDLIVYLTEY